jgi:transposase
MVDKAAKRVGVSYLTLLKWEKKSGKKIKTKRGRPPGKKAALKKAMKVSKEKKKAKATAKEGGLTLVTPTGFRIEGITSAELIKVLRGLK